MERHKECSWKTLDECTDMWTHLFAGVVNEEDYGSIFYDSNKYRSILLKDNYREYWSNFKVVFGVDWVNIPDIIIARGGFNYYKPVLKKFKKSKKVYYGANHGCIPKDGIKYDLILCDSEEQVNKCRKRGLNGQLFIKPAAPHFFPRTVEKKYDVGFSAIWPKDKRKRVSWVHKTAPRDLKILQMGHACKTPSNFSVKYIKHDRMPRAISKCKVIIAPYTSEDSCPRIIPESLACDVPVVALDSCQFWHEKYCLDTESKTNFWRKVKKAINWPYGNLIKTTYDKDLSLPVAANHLRELIIYG